MFGKLIRISWTLYRNIVLFNFFFSFVALVTFAYGGFNRPGVYYLSLFIKLVGYGFSLSVNNLFYQKYSYFYKNLGFSYKKLWRSVFLADLFCYGILIFIAWALRNFI